MGAVSNNKRLCKPVFSFILKVISYLPSLRVELHPQLGFPSHC